MLRRISKRLSDWQRRSVRSAIDPIVKNVIGQRRNLVLHTRVIENDEPIANPLNRGYRCYFSQNDEDGILLEIIRRIGVEHPSVCLEIGVGDGLANNTLILLAHRWHGVWIDTRTLAFDPSNSRLSFLEAWITKENAAETVARAAGNLGKSLSEIRVASIDVDGNDYHVASTLLSNGLHPDVLIVEYNAKFPPSADFVMSYNPEHHWTQNTDYFGVSLKSWSGLLSKFDYRLVACNLSGANGFYVDRRYSDKFADVPEDIETLFMPGSYRPLHRSGWPTSPKTVEQMIRDG
jgi:hypothetical protein